MRFGFPVECQPQASIRGRLDGHVARGRHAPGPAAASSGPAARTKAAAGSFRRPRREGTGVTALGPASRALFMVVVGKHVFVFPIFACCGLVGNPNLTAKMSLFTPLPTSTKFFFVWEGSPADIDLKKRVPLV